MIHRVFAALRTSPRQQLQISGLLLSRFPLRNKVTQSYEAVIAHLALKKHVPDSNVSTSCARSRVYSPVPDMMPSWLNDCCCHTGVMGWDGGAERSDAPAPEVLRVRRAALFLSGGGSAVVWAQITSRTSPSRSPSVPPALHAALANANSSLPYAARYLLILANRGTTRLWLRPHCISAYTSPLD